LSLSLSLGSGFCGFAFGSVGLGASLGLFAGVDGEVDCLGTACSCDDAGAVVGAGAGAGVAAGAELVLWSCSVGVGC